MKSLHRKKLLVAIGSGRDLAFTSFLIDKQSTYDIIGVLTPNSIHTINGYVEKQINKLDNNDIWWKGDGALSNRTNWFFEKDLHKIFQKKYPNIKNTYLLSLHWGTQKLTKSLASLIQKEKYEEIIAFDVGGDILGWKNKKELLSPISDFSCLSCLLNAAGKRNISLYVIAPGLDGELSPKTLDRSLKQIDHEVKVENIVAHPKYEEIMQINETINKQTKSTSNLYTFFKKLKINKKEYRGLIEKKIAIGDALFIGKTNIYIDKKWSNKIIKIDPKKLFNVCEIPEIKYENIIEANRFFHKVGFDTTEVDLNIVPLKLSTSGWSKSSILLYYPTYISEDQRAKIKNLITKKDIHVSS